MARAREPLEPRLLRSIDKQGDGLICHRCDRPLCINPSHLFIGSPRDNTQDMIRKGRRATVRGCDHPNTKIPPDERQNIKRLRGEGRSLKEIATAYGVSFQLISDICNGRRNYASGN
jgi:hypothetical protein